MPGRAEPGEAFGLKPTGLPGSRGAAGSVDADTNADATRAAANAGTHADAIAADADAGCCAEPAGSIAKSGAQAGTQTVVSDAGSSCRADSAGGTADSGAQSGSDAAIAGADACGSSQTAIARAGIRRCTDAQTAIAHRRACSDIGAEAAGIGTDANSGAEPPAGPRSGRARAAWIVRIARRSGVTWSAGVAWVAGISRIISDDARSGTHRRSARAHDRALQRSQPDAFAFCGTAEAVASIERGIFGSAVASSEECASADGAEYSQSHSSLLGELIYAVENISR
jgi:hypothetical protein